MASRDRWPIPTGEQRVHLPRAGCCGRDNAPSASRNCVQLCLAHCCSTALACGTCSAGAERRGRGPRTHQPEQRQGEPDVGGAVHHCHALHMRVCVGGHAPWPTARRVSVPGQFPRPSCDCCSGRCTRSLQGRCNVGVPTTLALDPSIGPIVDLSGVLRLQGAFPLMWAHMLLSYVRTMRVRKPWLRSCLPGV